MKLEGTSEAGAKFSDDRKRRYILWRVWDKSRPKVVFCLKNPSTAGGFRGDPTVDALEKRVRFWGAASLFSEKQSLGGFFLVNASSLISSDPKILIRASADDDINFDVIKEVTDRTGQFIVCGWGQLPDNLEVHGKPLHDYLLKILKKSGKPLTAFHLNKDGTPKHPLYIADDAIPKMWKNGKLLKPII